MEKTFLPYWGEGNHKQLLSFRRKRKRAGNRKNTVNTMKK
jgi:hypothetical protein